MDRHNENQILVRVGKMQVKHRMHVTRYEPTDRILAGLPSLPLRIFHCLSVQFPTFRLLGRILLVPMHFHPRGVVLCLSRIPNAVRAGFALYFSTRCLSPASGSRARPVFSPPTWMTRSFHGLGLFLMFFVKVVPTNCNNFAFETSAGKQRSHCSRIS